MRGLVSAELLRIRKRRATTWLALLLLAITALVVVVYALNTKPPSADDIANAQEAYQQTLRDWQRHGDEYLQDCLDQQEEDRKTDPSADYDCESMNQPPQPEDFEWWSGAASSDLPFLVVGFAAAAAAVMLLLAATFVGADNATGTLSTQLLFAPTRWKVWLAKAVALVVTAVVGAVAAMAVGGFASWLVIRWHALTPDAVHTAWGSLLDIALWMLPIVVAVTLVAYAVSWLFGHTVAIVAVTGGVLIAEQILANAVPSSTPWLPGTNLLAIALKTWTYNTYPCVTTPQGVSCEAVEHTLTRGHGLTMWAIVLVVTLGASLWWFRRRDVS